MTFSWSLPIHFIGILIFQDNPAVYNHGHLVQGSSETIMTSKRGCLNQDLCSKLGSEIETICP